MSSGYKVIVFVTLVWVNLQQAFSQERKFELMVNNKKIGDLKASRLIEKGTTIYELKSSSTLSFLTTIDIKVDVLCIFSDEHNLIESRYNNYVNKNVTDESNLKWTEGAYKGERDNKQIKLEAKRISYCTTNLYIDEPGNRTKVFSENHLKFLELKKKTLHSYSLMLPDGEENIYEYKDGILVKAILSHKLYEITVRYVE